jgi:dienelactone hydrolase
MEPPNGWVPFRAAVAYYPLCRVQLGDTNAPLLILSGELDSWCPPASCQKNIPSGKIANEVILKIYPGAYHGFDMEGVDMVMLNRHRVLYNPAAHADSIIQVKDFFAKQMK